MSADVVDEELEMAAKHGLAAALGYLNNPSFLAREDESIRSQYRLFAPWLKQRFAHFEVPGHFLKYDPAPYFQRFAGLYDPDFVPERNALQGVQTTELALMLGVYCHAYPVKLKPYRQLLKGIIRNRDAYEYTHALWGFVYMRDRGCDTFHEARSSYDMLVMGTLNIVKNTTTIDDVQLEAAGILLELGHGDLMPPDFLGKVLMAQNPDGGWSWFEDEGESNLHSTALGFWYLSNVLNMPRPKATEKPQ